MLLAAVNQVFSLLDPYIFRQIIDRHVVKAGTSVLETGFWALSARGGAGLLILQGDGRGHGEPHCQEFQDYYTNVITQRLGAELYSDGLRHSLELPYQVFEDQRSGETLGKLQKVRTDVEKLIQSFVNILFISLVGIVFVTVVRPERVLAHCGGGTSSPFRCWASLSLFLSKRIKVIQKTIVAETTALAGSTTESLRNIELIKSLGLAQQETCA